jgi:NADH-quinone oxidoreductase subunit L
MAPGAPEAIRGLEFGYGVLVDNLTVIMLVVVTGVSFLVHLYSTAYMRDHHGHPEERYNRFFAYLALFTFSMLQLVIADNLFVLFVSWELVGVCSYFLIGFYFHKPSAAHASMKAFLTNRVGDFGFFLGIMVVIATIGTFDYASLFESVKPENVTRLWGAGWSVEAGATRTVPTLLTAAALLLFCGAIGKSAQFPLHVWLPDAMEGPTPVSALIHAATMVAAGVYMVARLFPFFAGPGYFEGDYFGSPALWGVAGIGTITAFMAATIAMVQTDIKKVLAYSTCSQLGYMVIGIGVGSFTAGMFHLFTHAWFKACLFLGSGSVIHAVHTNEMTDMGGLRKKMPITFATFLVSTMAISGVPFLAGYWSKESIVTQALAFGIYHGSFLAQVPFALALITAGLTAFYMFRIIFLTFTGEPRDPHKYDHAHENPWPITLPLCILGILAVLAGGVYGKATHWFEHRVNPDHTVGQILALTPTGPAAEGGFTAYTVKGWTPAPEKAVEAHGAAAAHAPVAATATAAERFESAHHAAHTPTLVLALAVAITGIFLSWFVFSFYAGHDFVGKRGALASIKTFLLNLWYIDWAYYRFVIAGVLAIRRVCGLFDKYVVDGAVNLAGRVGVVVSKVSGVVDYWGVDGSVRGVADSVLKAGGEARKVQTGSLQEYVYLSVMLIAFIFVVWTIAGTVL